MGKITVETCGIEGLKVITPTVFGDARGYFMETYNYNDFKEAGIDQVFVQDNQSASVKNVLRGLHFQIQYPQDERGGLRCGRRSAAGFGDLWQVVRRGALGGE